MNIIKIDIIDMIIHDIGEVWGILLGIDLFNLKRV